MLVYRRVHHFFLHFQNFLTNRIAAYTTQPRSAPPIVPSKTVLPAAPSKVSKHAALAALADAPDLVVQAGPGRSRQVQAGRRSRSNTSHVIPQNKWIQCETRMFEGVYFILRGRLRGFHKHPMAALTGSLG